MAYSFKNLCGPRQTNTSGTNERTHFLLMRCKRRLRLCGQIKRLGQQSERSGTHLTFAISSILSVRAPLKRASSCALHQS